MIHEQASYRRDTIDDLYSRARAGDKVGGKLFMKFLNEGVEEYKVASEYTYEPENGRVPTPYEHYVQHEMPVPIYRPRVMINATDLLPLAENEQFMMLDLYRNALASKSSLTTGNRRTDENVTDSNMTSLTLSLVSLNLGHLNRQPIMAGALKFDKWIRESEKVLPYLVFQNGGHIITLCEASDDQGGIERHASLCLKNGCIGMVVHSHADISAPALACFLRGSTKDLSNDESILVLHGQLDVDDMVVPAYRTGVTNRDVFRMGLSEVRIAVFHLSSFGWRSAYQERCDNWLKFLTAAIAAQVDFITGDGNLFAQRNFKQGAHTDYKSWILIDLLERLLAEINPYRSGMNQITYNLCSSIQAGAYIRAMSGDSNVSTADCMIMISLSYGKQSQVSPSRTASTKATADGVVGSAFSDEVLIQDTERPKYLQNIDLGRKDSDRAAHSPLIAIAKLYCQRNLRVRSDQSDQRRRGRRGIRQPRYAQRAANDDDEEEEVEVEEEEENEPVGRLRSTTPSSGARLAGREEQSRGAYENPNRRIPVAPPKTPPIPPPRRRERSVTPPGRNTQRRTEAPPAKTPPRRPPQRSWHQQQQDQYNYYNQPYSRSAPSAPTPTPPPPPPAPVGARPVQTEFVNMHPIISLIPVHGGCEILTGHGSTVKVIMGSGCCKASKVHDPLRQVSVSRQVSDADCEQVIHRATPECVVGSGALANSPEERVSEDLGPTSQLRYGVRHVPSREPFPQF
eukprot:s2991_g1.t1